MAAAEIVGMTMASFAEQQQGQSLLSFGQLVKDAISRLYAQKEHDRMLSCLQMIHQRAVEIHKIYQGKDADVSLCEGASFVDKFLRTVFDMLPVLIADFKVNVDALFCARFVFFHSLFSLYRSQH
jgi:hypothetical protein